MEGTHSPVEDEHSVSEEYGELQVQKDCSNNDLYKSRKPHWWTQLAGRRGTKRQRQAIQRMAERGYCIPKEILTNFSRINNRSINTQSPMNAATTDAVTGDWKRNWWDRALAISDSDRTPISLVEDINIVINQQNEKYTHKFQEMAAFKSTLQARVYKQKWLEIGFGKGANLFSNAQNNHCNLYIGSEIHQPGIGALAQEIEKGLEMGNAVENIRILPGDGIKLLSHLPGGYLDCILITFPDPWPKELHKEWRVIQTDTIRQMKRVLNNNGRVFVATDAECFDSWSREIFSQENTEWKEIIPCPPRKEWLPIISYYEQKGINEGRHTMLQAWLVQSTNSI